MTAVGLSGSSDHDEVGLVNDGLHDLLFLGAEDFGQSVVELGLALLHSCGGKKKKGEGLACWYHQKKIFF